MRNYLALSNKSPFYLILTGFGLLQLVIAVIALLFISSFVIRSDRTDGVVVGFQMSPRVPKSYAQLPNPPVAPIVEFTPEGGKPVRIVGSFFERQPSSALGDVVPVRYQPDEPQSAIIDVFADKWTFPLMFVVVGILFMAAARFFDRRPT